MIYDHVIKQLILQDQLLYNNPTLIRHGEVLMKFRKKSLEDALPSWIFNNLLKSDCFTNICYRSCLQKPMYDMSKIYYSNRNNNKISKENLI